MTRPTLPLALAALLLTAPAVALAQDGSAVGAQAAGAEARATPPRLDWDPNDPRIGLAAGWHDAESAVSGMEHLASLQRAEGFFNPETPGDGRFSNTDLAFQGPYMFQGNYNGFQVYDISDPASPTLRVSVVCPGGQGDVSVYGNLLVMSAQETRGRLDCGVGGVEEAVSGERLRGIRIFDISDLDSPRQVAAIQSCRGSHTHTLVEDPDDDEHVYVYIQGTNSPRPGEEMAGCSGAEPDEDPNTSLFRIEVVRVPLANPGAAEIVNMPRIFADPETGRIDALHAGGAAYEGAQRTRRTHQCHDITAYPALGLAAGACSGNGILLDISDPANPVRIDEVFDPNFAYWHSATFSNDGSKLVFTDEWGGGSAPRCRGTDPATWGANAIFRRQGDEMTLAGYYKLPVAQSETENCVAHNGSLVPVPGRDIKVQAWYQGGVSVMDFTDPANPFEIAYFDRGPLSETELYTGGFWSTYWYNGHIYGAEISRGIDVFRLTPSEHLSEAEIAAAELVTLDEFNAQMQPHLSWPDAAPVARAYLDQMIRAKRILAERAEALDALLERAETDTASAAELQGMAATLEADAAQVEAGLQGGDAARLSALAGVLRGMAGM
ncbi:MAG: hypothetical protein JSU98_00380 [Gemmatimonadales bacterium]|nr:MAG: hypothetical protein JSU98_00380 [Gemmatimonadales bacterium]